MRRAEGRGWSRYPNAAGLGVLALLVVAMGWIEVAQPAGLRFRDLTGGLVTFDTLVRIGILTIVVVGLNLLMGYAGQISLGQAAFYGVGAYASAIMTTLVSRHSFLPGISNSWWWPWMAMAVGMAVTGTFAYAIGRPILKLRGNYLAMATLGLGIVMFTLFRELDSLTGGSDGIAGIPRLRIGNLATLWPMERYYYLVWTAALAVMALGLNIVNSRAGRALRAIHGSELAANTTGVDTDHYKLQVLVISAVFASLAGSLYAHFQTLISPTPFSFQASVELVVMAAVGGLASIWGAPLGAGIVFVVREVLRARLHALLHGAGGEHEAIIYGIILVLVMMFMPQGLTVGALDALRRTRLRWTRWARGYGRTSG